MSARILRLIAWAAIALLVAFGAIRSYSANAELRSQLRQTREEYKAYRTFIESTVESGHFAATQGWTAKTHVTAVQSSGAIGCFDCHEEKFCSDCHVNGAAEILEQDRQ